jgi:hypothetical protein
MPEVLRLGRLRGLGPGYLDSSWSMLAKPSVGGGEAPELPETVRKATLLSNLW